MVAFPLNPRFAIFDSKLLITPLIPLIKPMFMLLITNSSLAEFQFPLYPRLLNSPNVLQIFPLSIQLV